MGFVIAAVALVGALAALDLLLTVAVLRRLREHETTLARLRPGGSLDGLVGRPIPDFELTTLEGRTVTESSLRGRPWVLAFLSMTCEPCREQLPALQRVAVGGAEVVAVVAGDAADGNGFVDDIRAALHSVAVADGSGDLGAELGVSSYPTLLAVDEGGVVSAATHDVAGLGSPGA